MKRIQCLQQPMKNESFAHNDAHNDDAHNDDAHNDDAHKLN